MKDGEIQAHHRWFEDVMALIIGTSLVSFGIVLLKQVGMVTGGTAGLSLFISYSGVASFELIFFLINLPFYYLAARKIGWIFTIKTFIAVALVSVFSNIHGQFIQIEHLNPLYGAILGSFFFGIGILIVFRHKASLGGTTILGLYLQQRTGLQAGWILMSIDVCIILASSTLIGPFEVLLSVGCVVMLNLIIALNHRTDRYLV